MHFFNCFCPEIVKLNFHFSDMNSGKIIKQFYQSISLLTDFRYSARMLSVMLIGFILLYKVGFVFAFYVLYIQTIAIETIYIY